MGWKPCLLLCVVVLAGTAQDLQFRGPVAGLVYDPPTRSLRRILGVPGAARLGPSLAAELDWASVAPNGSEALVLSQGEFHLVRNTLGGQDTFTRVDGISNIPRLAAWTKDSQSVVLYSLEHRSIQRVRLPEGTPLADMPFKLGIDGEVVALLPNKNAETVFVAIAGSGVYQAGPAVAARQIIPVADGPSFVINAEGRSLWAVDRTRAQLLSVQGLETSNPSIQIVATDVEKFGDICAVQLSSDESRLYLVSRATHRLYSFDIAAGQLSDGIELDSAPTGFQVLGRPTLLLAGSRTRTDEPLYLLDESNGLSLFFVPPGEER